MGADCWLCTRLKNAERVLDDDPDDPSDDAKESAIGLRALDVVMRTVRDYCDRQIRIAAEADRRAGMWQESERMASRRSAFEDVLSAIHVAMSDQNRIMGG